MAEWYEDFFPGLYYKVLAGMGESPDEARTVKRLLRVRKGRRVLDIPCGMGRLTLPLARMGLVMTGVDLSNSYLRRARRLARKEGLDIRFIRSDMRDIDFDSQFHAAFNWWGSFGYFSHEENLAFCRKVLKALKPGGRFLIEGPNKSYILSHFRAHNEGIHGGVAVTQDVVYRPATGRIVATWTFQKGRISERRTSDMWFFNGADIRKLLRAAGFRHVKLYGRTRGQTTVTRLTRHSHRIIAVGTKPSRKEEG